MELWQGIVGAVVAGLALVIPVFFKGVRDWIESKFNALVMGLSPDQEIEALKRIKTFHTIFERVRDLAYVDRVLLFTGGNCGGIPDAGKPYIVNCFYGWSTVVNHHPEDIYNFDLRVDSEYIGMVLKMIEHGKVVMTYDKMPDCLLKSYYADEKGKKVIQSRIYLLRRTKKQILYCSIASYQNEFNILQVREIDMLVDRVLAIIPKGQR